MNINGIVRFSALSLPVLLFASSGSYRSPANTPTPPKPAQISAAVAPYGSAPTKSNSLDNAFADAALQGPDHAVGLVIWSHGRALTREDSESPTPLYLHSFVAAGWDVMRFDRPRIGDLLDR